MELISIQALALLTAAILIVKLLPSRAADAGLAMLTVYVLYVNNSTANFVISLGILAAVYYIGIWTEKSENGRVISGITVALLVFGLIAWKYPNFFVWNINRVTRLFLKREFLHTVKRSAPFGISYGFLILIAYVLGIYWGQIKPFRNIFQFTHTAAFFPVWIMGPILGADDLENRGGLHVSFTSLCRGGQRILWGIFKKLVISERCAVIVNAVYGDTGRYGGLYIVIGTLFFVVQLYTEFSGAMDIVNGAAETIGKVLPENFDRPFSSTSVSEFWRRWHITLGTWLKNFVLYPILKSRTFQEYGTMLKKRFGKKVSKRMVTYTGLFISWFLIGLWHGGSWNYIFGSGIYYWILIVGGELMKPVFDRICGLLQVNRECWSYQAFAKIRTTLFFAFGMLFFRAGRMSAAIAALKALAREYNPWILVDGSLLKLGLDAKDMNVLILSVGLLYAVSRIKETCPLREWMAGQNLVFRWVVYYGLIFSILIFGCYGAGYDAASFIYQGF